MRRQMTRVAFWHLPWSWHPAVPRICWSIMTTIMATTKGDYRQAQQYGYQQGFRDGYDRGKRRRA